MAEGNSQSMTETVKKPRGILPMMAYTGRLRPKGVPFSRLQVYERVGILFVKVYERVGKSVIWVCEMV